MKTLVSAFAIVTAAFVGCRNDFTPAGRGAPGTADPLVVRAHFMGADQLLKDPNGSQLKEIWNLKSSADLRNRAFDQFARLPFLWLSNSLPKNSPDQSTMFRALFTDALAHESFL